MTRKVLEITTNNILSLCNFYKPFTSFISILMTVKIQSWCPTKIDDSGDAKSMLGWGICGPGCPIASDGWRDDDATFIVEYSDVETWRMTAFLIMICIGGCLLVTGLLVSLLVICFGKLIYLLSSDFKILLSF